MKTLIKTIIITFCLSIVLTFYGCKTAAKGCDCPSFGNKSTNKSGVHSTKVPKKYRYSSKK